MILESRMTESCRPLPQRVAASRLSAFIAGAQTRWGREFKDYAALHRWSIEQADEFWVSLWDFAGVIGERGERVVVDRDRMPGARWFPEARLNYAENLLRRRDDADALVFWGEGRVSRRLSHGELHRQVAQLAAAMRALGVVQGDRIAAYLPNLPEAIVVMLAAASIGAIYTSASPDFGVQGVLDRFGQVEPKLLFAADGYFYNGKTIDSLAKIAAVAAQLPSVLRVVIAPYAHASPDLAEIRNATLLEDIIAPHQDAADIEYARLPFDHPTTSCIPPVPPACQSASCIAPAACCCSI